MTKPLLRAIVLASLPLLLVSQCLAADKPLNVCKKANGAKVFTHHDCDRHPDLKTLPAINPKFSNLKSSERDVAADEKPLENSDAEDKESEAARLARIRKKATDFQYRLVNSKLASNTILDASDFLREKDLSAPDVPSHEDIEVEYMLTDFSMGECCLRVVRGTKYSAQKICENKGKQVWRYKTRAPTLGLDTPIKRNNSCFVYVADKLDGQSRYSCSVKGVAQCYWKESVSD